MMLKLAAERGCTVVTGVEMFVRQAAHQFSLYTGEPAPMGLMRDILKRKLGPFREWVPTRRTGKVWRWSGRAAPESRPSGEFSPNDWCGRSWMPMSNWKPGWAAR